MLDELAIIDIFEKLKTSLVDAAPAVEHELLELRDGRWREAPPEFFREKLVAALLDVDLSAASGRRQVKRLLGSLDSDDSLARSLDALLSVADAKARSLRVSDVTPKNIHDLKDALHRLDGMTGGTPDGLGALIEAQGHPTKVVELFSRAIPYLRGLKVYQFLRSLEYPIVTPDAARQRLLYRIGLWPETGQSRERLLAFQELCGSVARLTGESMGGVDLILGLYCGAIKRRKQFAPPCVARPLCEDCAINGQCSFHRYRGSFPETDTSNIRNMRPENRPREKFERVGAENVNDADLLAILLRTGLAGKSALEVATNLLRVFESLEGLDTAALSELTAVKGVGRGKAVEIKAAIELGKRLFTRPLSKGVQITCSSDVFNAYHLRFRASRQEEFLLLCLNTKNQVTKESRISVGSLNQSVVHPREVFKEAIRESAHGVLFVHNHPSGDPRPSNADIDLTRQLKDAGEMLKIRILDHIVIGERNYYSFLDNGTL